MTIESLILDFLVGTRDAERQATYAYTLSALARKLLLGRMSSYMSSYSYDPDSEDELYEDLDPWRCGYANPLWKVRLARQLVCEDAEYCEGRRFYRGMRDSHSERPWNLLCMYLGLDELQAILQRRESQGNVMKAAE